LALSELVRLAYTGLSEGRVQIAKASAKLGFMRYLLAVLIAFSFPLHANDPAHTPPGVMSKGTEPKKSAKPVDPTNPPIKAGTEITVNDYHKDTDVFMVTMNAEPDIGPNFATSTALWKALEFEGSVKQFVKNKDQLIGSIFTLKKELPLVDPQDLVKKYKKVLDGRKPKKRTEATK
jgi:hypothetical protein